MKKVVSYLSFGLLILLCTATNVSGTEVKTAFLEACDASPHIDEGSNCSCVYNEVVHQFGESDAEELIPFINGDKALDSEINDALSFISGKCEG